ncbi:MAG: ribonuclease P protein component [Alphaproteobacteria bacterium]|nr:ribonuclease P protein component [Alphaproteobacteria bacterium]
MKRKTIRNHKDFLTALGDYKVNSYNIVVRAKSAKIPNDARYGLFAPKKTFKLATDRNRAKRMLRDWIAFNEDLMLPELDYIFVARGPVLTRRRDPGRKEMGILLQNIAQLHKKHAKKAK